MRLMQASFFCLPRMNKTEQSNVFRNLLTFVEHKPTNVGRIDLERQARQFNSWSLV